MKQAQVPLRQVASLFLKLGFIGFGGPAAHIAMMHKEVVVSKKWMDEQSFLDLVGATNLIPGPNSTEMAIHIGYEKAGWKGLITAGLCFILPAVCITAILAMGYYRYGKLPAVQPFIYGIKPAIIAVIITAVIPLAKKSLKNRLLVLIAILVLACSAFFRINEVFLMLGAGLMALAGHRFSSSGHIHSSAILLGPLLHTSGWNSPLNLQLFWIFLKTGAVLYGSGYVLFALLDTSLVQTGMISRTVLMDAVAVGQFTPGPVFSAVTFIGYQVNGWSGALTATIGIFLPGFVLVALIKPLVKKLRDSRHFSVFLDAVNAASVALIASVCISMGRESIMDWRTTLIALASLGISMVFPRVNSALVVLSGATLGWLLRYI